MTNTSISKRILEFTFFAGISSIYIYSAYREGCAELIALREKYGSNGHKTFGIRLINIFIYVEFFENQFYFNFAKKVDDSNMQLF